MRVYDTFRREVVLVVAFTAKDFASPNARHEDIDVWTPRLNLKPRPSSFVTVSHLLLGTRNVNYSTLTSALYHSCVRGTYYIHPGFSHASKNYSFGAPLGLAREYDSKLFTLTPQLHPVVHRT